MSYDHNRLATVAGVFVLAGIISATTFSPSSGGTMKFSLSSTDFQNGADIPKKFTCDGADTSPELTWTGEPKGTKSFALIADDPDAPSGTFLHWVIFSVPADVHELPANVSKIDELPDGTRQGRNGFQKIGYGGPCPPPGKSHRYFFRLYALDTMPDLKPGASREELEKAMQGHTLATAEWMGKYHRQ